MVTLLKKRFDKNIRAAKSSDNIEVKFVFIKIANIILKKLFKKIKNT